MQASDFSKRLDAPPIQADAPSSSARVIRVEHGVAEQHDDLLAQECPVALEFNGIAHAVMLASPLELEDFALGFALTEGIIDQASELYDIKLETSPQGIAVKLEIASRCFVRLKTQRRHMAGPTGCGICGTESISHVLRPMPRLSAPVQKLDTALIKTILAALNKHQPLQQLTGATHAAAWFDRHGSMKLLREDIGRHNALDKVIGAAMRKPLSDRPDGPMVVTSRASMEMVQKTLISGARYLIALSAPTSLAVTLADQHGLCLIGFARETSFNVYSHPQYLTGLSA